jgi:hypothetical protein
MNFMGRMLSAFFICLAMLFTLTSLSAEWLFELGTVTDQFGNRVSLLDLERKGEQIANETQTSLERVLSKERVAESLTTGELTLVEAAALFRSMYDDPKAWHHPQRRRPGREDGEAWCREVIEWTVTKVRIDQSPSQADAVRQRLEMELQEQQTYHGTVRLPD